MRNQLLRDADWAGMAHGVEIRLPLVDTTLLETLSAVIGQIMPGAGKLALAAAPSHPLPDEIVARAKTGFGVPTSAWAGDASASSGLRSSGKSKGLTSRRWSQLVVKAVARPATSGFRFRARERFCPAVWPFGGKHGRAIAGSLVAGARAIAPPMWKTPLFERCCAGLVRGSLAHRRMSSLPILDLVRICAVK